MAPIALEAYERVTADEYMERIPEFYAGKSVFLTGATGFVGKIILEKLLRSCPGIDKVYVLARAKKDKTAQERVDDLFTQAAFEVLRDDNPDYFEKVVAVQGELCQPNLGISENDTTTLIENVSIIIHCAASIKFTEPLRVAVETNVVPVVSILKLARELLKCEALVYVSTAYSQTISPVIEEKAVPTSYDPKKIIELVKLLDDDLLEKITPELVGKRPNTYTLTKSMAEDLLRTDGKGLPVAICRPSIVATAYRTPYPGWCDSVSGPPAMTLACGAGMVRVLAGFHDCRADIVPVDFAANYTIVAAWYAAQQAKIEGPTKEVLVFNCTSGVQNPITWGAWAKHVTETFDKVPLEKGFRRNKSPILVPSVDGWQFKLGLFLFNTIPANATDAILRLQGKKPTMVKMFGRLNKSLKDYGYFATHSWDWRIDNTYKVMKAMHPADQEVFSISLKDMNWEHYIRDCCIGMKKFVMKESIEDLDKAHAATKRLTFIAHVTKIALVVLLLAFLFLLAYVFGVL